MNKQKQTKGPWKPIEKSRKTFKNTNFQTRKLINSFKKWLGKVKTIQSPNQEKQKRKK